MPDTTGRIRAKALDTTGITEAMLDKDWSAGAGRTRMAIVELRSVEPHGPNIDGKKRIDYVIEAIEPVPEKHEDVVREFQRAIYHTRPEVEGQATLKGIDSGPTVDQTAEALSHQIERDAEGEVTGTWDGSMDGPLTAVPDAEDPVHENGCPYPHCTRSDEHKGPHRDAENKIIGKD